MDNIQKMTLQLLREKGIIDCHCDTITNLLPSAEKEYKFSEENKRGQLDLPRMGIGGIRVQFFAVCTMRRYRGLKETLEMIACYHRNLIDNEQKIGHVNLFSDIQTLNDQGKIAAILSIEGGEALDGDPLMLDIMYRLGVRCLSLTWNYQNQLADSHEENGERGLTEPGRMVIRRMETLGMLVDLAHISTRSFFDVLEYATKPAIVSHANAKSVCNHSRNLSDEQLKALSQKKGVVGLTFYPRFIADNIDECNIDKLIDHFVHIASVAGVESIALGSDFDGIDITMRDIFDCTCYDRLVSGLLTRGFSRSEVELITFGNALRILKENIK